MRGETASPGDLAFGEGVSVTHIETFAATEMVSGRQAVGFAFYDGGQQLNDPRLMVSPYLTGQLIESCIQQISELGDGAKAQFLQGVQDRRQKSRGST